jgi:lysophospholipase L1-like esterase
MKRRSFVIGGGALGLFIATQGEGNAMTHVAMLGDSVFDNASYVGGAPDVRAQLQSILTGARVTSTALDGAMMADIPKQLRQMPRSATHIVVSIGGNDAIRASGVIDERATSVAAALDRLAAIRDQFERNYRTVIDLLLEQSLPVAFCSIYEPRFPDMARRRAAATALAVLNDAITRQVFTKRASLIDLRLVCDHDADFANPIEPSATGGEKIARAIAILRAPNGQRQLSSEVPESLSN